MALLGGGEQVLQLKAKKESKQKTQKGGFWAKWGGPLATSPDPYTLQKQKNTKKTKQKTKPKNREGLGLSEVALWATSPDP